MFSHLWDFSSLKFLLRGAGGWRISVFLNGSVSAAAPRTLKFLLEPLVHAEVVAARGENVTLPCILRTKPSQYEVKWTKVEVEKLGQENVIIISSGHAWKTYGRLGRRAWLRKAHVLDASLQLSRLELEDGGRYRCQLIHDLHDESVFITLRIQGISQPCQLFFFFFLLLSFFPGVVFPYQSKKGRYKFSYDEAKRACAQQDAVLASHQQLFRGHSFPNLSFIPDAGRVKMLPRVSPAAWTEGLDWCNAGWLSDGTVRYPIIHPRPSCGVEKLPGLRSYGSKDKEDSFDAFCFTSQTAGEPETLHPVCGGC